MSYLNRFKHRVTLDGFVNKVAKQPVRRTGVSHAMFHHRLRIGTPRKSSKVTIILKLRLKHYLADSDSIQRHCYISTSYPRWPPSAAIFGFYSPRHKVAID